MKSRKRIIQRIIDGESIFPMFKTQEKLEMPESVIRRWRERGVPQSAIDMAMKMADRWLEAILK